MREFLDKIRKPLAPRDPRRHHFLPQFFLKRFVNEKHQLVVVRLDDPDAYDMTNVENVAVMKDLYTTIDAEIGETAWQRLEPRR